MTDFQVASSNRPQSKLQQVLADLFDEKLSQGECDDFYSDDEDIEENCFAPLSAATPDSLSIDDSSVKITETTFTMPVVHVQRQTKPTLVNIPSIVDATLVERRLAQLDKVMEDLESSAGFWGKADLLLQDSWLNGYRASFLEQSEDLLRAADSYSRAVSIYDAAAKLDQLTAKSSPHIVSYFHLLKRYINVLSDPSIPEELRDERRISELRARVNSIREGRKQWGMTSPDNEDEPFTYAKTILKVLCA